MGLLPKSATAALIASAGTSARTGVAMEPEVSRGPQGQARLRRVSAAQLGQLLDVVGCRYAVRLDAHVGLAAGLDPAETVPLLHLGHRRFGPALPLADAPPGVPGPQVGARPVIQAGVVRAGDGPGLGLPAASCPSRAGRAGRRRGAIDDAPAGAGAAGAALPAQHLPLRAHETIRCRVVRERIARHGPLLALAQVRRDARADAPRLQPSVVLIGAVLAVRHQLAQGASGRALVLLDQSDE